MDIVLPLIILLTILVLMLWALGLKRERAVNARMDRLEEWRRVDISAQDAQARAHDSRIKHLELRTFANSRDIVALANQLADASADPSDRKTLVSPAPEHEPDMASQIS